jgi:aldehyde:ferredoxin oxidoreductase
MSKFGYAGAILEVDVSQRYTVNLPTDEYADRFIGGRGLAAKLYWDKVPPQTKAFDPENCLIFVTGPMAGFTRLAGSRWQVCGKSSAMEPQFFSHANLGGSWGAWLKFAGYDAIAIQGTSEKPVYLFVHDGIAEIKDASLLWGKDTFEVQEILKAELGKEVRVAVTGPAGENLVSFATVLADEGSSGSSSFGSIMGSKKLKAIAVAGNKRPTAAQPERLAKLADRAYQLRGRHFDIPHKWIHEGRTKRQSCYGCVSGCARQIYKTDAGERVKFFCQMADMYEMAAIEYYGDWNEIVVHAAQLCQSYGLDTFVLEPMIAWLGKCYQQGILREEETGIPLSKIGSPEFIETLLRKISLREGFGDILAQGTIKAAEVVGKGAKELIGDSITTKANDLAMYDPRLFITNGLLYATEPRKPIQELHEVGMPMHEWAGLQGVGTVTEGQFPDLVSSDDIVAIAEKFWGSQAAGDLSTYEGKALAAKQIQDRTYAKESLILCDFLWPITFIRGAEGHRGDPTMESQVFSAVTGKETDEEELNRLGERIFNLQRAIHLREGWGGRQGDTLLDAFYKIPIDSVRFNPDCLVPGKGGQPFSLKGTVVDTEKFEKMKSEYYELRGWDITSGLPTMTKLQELELADVASDLEKRGLLA